MDMSTNAHIHKLLRFKQFSNINTVIKEGCVMQIIESSFFTTLLPDKGYKLVNKNTGKEYKKVILGKLDSVDNYGEILDDKYINVDYVVEMDELKKTFKEVNEQNEFTIDLLLFTIDELYVSVESLLTMIPSTIDANNIISNFVNFYALMIKRNLKDIDEIPEKFRDEIRKLL
jgi:hypothetical protein